jgi:hypothetical protein
MATEAQRTHVLHLLDYFHAHAAHLLYPPGDEPTSYDRECWGWSEQTLEHVLGRGGYWQGDCSDWGTYVWKLAGLWRHTVPGWTGSILKLLPTYTNAKAARVGAGVVFGGGTGHHFALVHTPDPKHGNPLLSSHGRPGFDAVHLHDLAAEQARMGHPGVRFCSIAHL